MQAAFTVVVIAVSLRLRDHSRVGGLDRAARQDADQVRAIFGAAVNIFVETFGRCFNAVEALHGEALLQRFLESRGAEDTSCRLRR